MDIRPLANMPPPAPGIADKSMPGTSVVASMPSTSAPVEKAAAVQQPVAVPNLDQVAQAVKSINKALQLQSQNLEFSVDSDSKRTIVKVVDQNSGEVLRQIPSEEVLEISKALDSLQQGLLIKQQV